MIAIGIRPSPQTGGRRARWLVVLLTAVVIGMIFAAPGARAQTEPGVLVRYSGTLRIGGRPAPAGTSITVITATRPEDIVVCGTGMVSGSGGAYAVDIPFKPECAPARHPSPTVPHIFVVNGENVGVAGAESRFLTLADRSGWGRTVPRDLQGTDIPGAGSGDRLGAPLPAVRYYGTVRFGNRFPSEGTVVRALYIRSVGDVVVCGTGSVTDRQGSYVVDVPLSPDCIPARHPSPTITHVFIVEGQNVGTGAAESRFLTLDSPTGWGRTSRRNLSGADIPDVQAGGTIRPPAIRYYGSVRIENQVAPAGTAVTVLGTRGGPTVTCGSGSVTDRQGSYYVDIILSPDCIPARHPEPTVNHLFVVNGKRVDSVGAESRFITLDTPVSWGEAVRRELRWVRNAPDAPSAGPVEPAPPEQVTEATGPAGSVGMLPCPPDICVTPDQSGEEGGLPLTPDLVAEDAPPALPPGSVFDDCVMEVKRVVVASAQDRQPACEETVPLVKIYPDPSEPNFETRVRDCFTLYRGRGGVAAALAADLDPDAKVSPTAHRVGIRVNTAIQNNRTRAPGDQTARTLQRADGSAGEGADVAVVEINPALVAPGARYPDGAERDFCTALLHELLHARDIIRGTVPPGAVQLRWVRYSDGATTSADRTSPLDCGELKVLVNENRYRRDAGLTPRRSYPNVSGQAGQILPFLRTDGTPYYPAYLFDAVNPADPLPAGPCGTL